MKRCLLGLVIAAAAGACSFDAPVIDYTGLACGAGDPCGGGYACNARGLCELAADAGSTTANGSTSGGTGGSTGATSGSSGTNGSGSGTSGGATGGTTNASSGSSSGGSASGGSTGTVTEGLPTLALGRAHGCQVNGQGGIYCWGNDDSGQLGISSLQSSLLPQQVVGFPASATAVAAGGDQSCALYSGAVICWGDQSEGVGVDTLSYLTTPAYVSGLNSGATAVAVGYFHACAIATGGAVKCWGDNDDGQLGNGGFTSSTGPVTVSTFASGASAIAAGDYHSCALRNGGVSCWGNNTFGQLGNGATGNPATTAVAVSNLTGVVAIAAGSNHTCAIVAGGAIQCWGANDSDQLGTTFAPQSGSSTPVPVTGFGAGGATAVAIAAGGDHSCAISSSGDVLCWGSDTYGELGSNPSAPGASLVTGLAPPTIAIAAGQHSTCAQSASGSVFCWGYGGDGELGGNSVQSSPSPESLVAGNPPPDGGSGPPSVVALVGGVGNSFALTASGQALAWGENLDGQLGTGDLETRLLPTPLDGFDAGVTSIAVGTDHGCAALTTGVVYCWGSNESGQLGNGSTTSSLVPVTVSGLPGSASAVACGGGHSCAISQGALYCWGENPTGELGNGTTTSSDVPVAVVGLDGGVAEVQANQGVTCALTVDGGLYCWGANPSGLLGNGNGQVGNANGIPSTTPAQVTGLPSGVISFSIGSNHGCAVTSAGAVECWGEDFFGELGDGNAFGQGAPVPVSGLGSGFSSVTVGDHHSCALTQQGEVFCWGRGSYGEIGNGSSADKNYTPSSVTGLGSGVSAIAAGDDHTCALTAGGILCWGYGGDGSMGAGTLDNAAITQPVQ